MSAVFLKIINLSITASWLILAVILVRSFLKKTPKWISCVLWALVAIRLVCPFSLESALSLIPSSETIPSNIEMMQKPAIDSGITVINETINPAIAHSFAPEPMTSANPLQIIIPLLSIVWIVGMVAMFLYAFISYIKLKKNVVASAPVRDNILACDEVKSPFILGIIKPLIYVPSSMEGETLDYVITHELAHIRRRDHWWKPFGFLLLAVYWFNPLCWLAYVLLCRDIEIACDEKVIRDMDKGSVAAYSQALLDCSFPRRRIAACPLAFGEVGVKERVKSVLNYKKPASWVIVLAVIACVVVAVCFLTNPKNYSEEIQVNGQIYLRQQNEVEILPTGSYELGRLLSILHRTKEHPFEDFSATNLDAKYAGNMLYQSGRDASTVYLEDLSGFYIPFTVVESTPDEVTFEAEVLEIHDGYFLVAPEVSWALNSADRIEVPMMSMDSAPEPQVDDIIEITCSGEILETYPARLSKVYSIKVAKKAYDRKYGSISRYADSRIPVSADFDHDGEDEVITLTEWDSGDIYDFTIQKKDGEVLWNIQAGTAHVGWTSLLLYRDNGKDYLVQYMPSMFQGVGEYTWTMMSFENGEAVTCEKMSVGFELPISHMNDKLREFEVETNELLENILLLFSTEQGVVTIGPVAAKEVPSVYPVRFDPDKKQEDMKNHEADNGWIE